MKGEGEDLEVARREVKVVAGEEGNSVEEEAVWKLGNKLIEIWNNQLLGDTFKIYSDKLMINIFN